jgi:HSP20 family protein
MKIVRWNPRYYNRMRWPNDFDRYVERELERPNWYSDVSMGLPVDVSESDEAFLVKASVPGVDPEKVEITFEEDVLTIKGEIEADSELEEENYHIRERQFGSFSRALRFPVSVNAEAIEASYEKGILTLNVPKAEEVKPKRIEVKVS